MQDVRGERLQARRSNPRVQQISGDQQVPVGTTKLDTVRPQCQVIGLLIEADFRWLRILQAGAEAAQDITQLEATLFFMSQRDIENFTFVEADDEGGDPAVTRHVIEGHHLEAGALSRRKSRDEIFQIARLADHGDGLGRGRLEGQCRLPRLGRLTIERQPALVPRGRSKDRRRRHGAAVCPGGRYPGRKAAKAQVRQNRSSCVRAIVRRRAVAEVQRHAGDVEKDRRHFLAEQRLLPVLVQELLDLGRRHPFAVFDQALDGTELLDQLNGRLFTDAADPRNIVRHVAHQALEIDGLNRFETVALPNTIRRVEDCFRHASLAGQDKDIVIDKL